MAQERANPLPPGRYWLQLFEPLAEGRPDARSVFAAWQREHTATVKTEVTETFERDSSGGKARVFVVFKVLSPTPFPIAPSVGFPDIVQKGTDLVPLEQSSVKASSDTEPPDPVAPSLDDFGALLGKVALVGGLVVGGLVLAQVLSLIPRRH